MIMELKVDVFNFTLVQAEQETAPRRPSVSWSTQNSWCCSWCPWDNTVSSGDCRTFQCLCLSNAYQCQCLLCGCCSQSHLVILHKAAFCSQPRVFLQDAETCRPLTLRHPTWSRVKCQGEVYLSGAWVLGQVNPHNLHLLPVLQVWDLNAFGISRVWRI